MKTKAFRILFGSALCCFLLAGAAGAATAPTGEEALFTTSTAPDALIVMDLSGSMAWNPAGDDLPYGSTVSCTADSTNCSGTGCSGGFCGSSKSGTSYYAAAACATADTTNCVGSNCSNGFCSSSKGATTIYAASSCSTPDYGNCRGTGCGRSDGFCNSTVSATTYYAHASCSTPDTYNCRYSESWDDCRDGFCASSHYSSRSGRSCQVACTTTGCSTPCTTTSCSVPCTSGGCTVNCSRLSIAKRSVFNILDDNNDGSINTSDETSLGVRLGYMRFYNCGDDDTGDSYTSGCITLSKAINSSYSSINTAVSGESALGGTPIVSSLREAKKYLDDHKDADSAKDCRQKFVILITDGSDTYSCGGDGSECDSDRYKNRREVVAKAKMLNDAGYKVFVIGFGTAMPPYLRNTLNWMAYYGGTDNPNAANSGSTSAYSIATGCNATPAVPSACCHVYATACYPSGVTGCGTDSSSTTATCYDASKPYPGTTGNSTTNFRASSNDPGYMDLSGYAFLAADADQLVAAVKAAITIIREATYSFSQASVQSSRTQDENYIYEGSFQPITGDPFWRGHFKKYDIDSNGEVTTLTWMRLSLIVDGDAGTKLRDRAAADRTIYTFKGGSRVAFNTTQITAADLGLTTTAERDAVVSYIRGDGSPDNWKLGDVFRATPITVGTPSVYFDDFRDRSGPPNAFAQHRTNHVRSSSGDTPLRIVLAGANDGQLHAFKASDGSEAWSFIPPNQLPRLKLIAHAAEPTSLIHQYFVDGPVTVADAWIPASAASGTDKTADWHTLAMFGLGRGGSTTLWSSSSYCDSGFSPTYSTTYQYYCGYYCLNLSTSLNGSPNPIMQWPPPSSTSVRVGLGLSSSQAPYMGAPWSKMMVGRVRIGGNERWVGFIGGGVYAAGAANSGKGFFIVDLYDGAVLWSYTRADNSALDNPMPAPPAIVDTDNDGFIDTVYIGDLGSNMWRFKFCLDADAASCGTTNWTGGRLFEANSSSGNRPIYTSVAVAMGSIWVYWGTGDKTDPTNPSAQEKFIALRDDDRSTSRTISNLQNITSEGSVYNDPSKQGYYLNLAGQGEKMLADPTVFGGVVYFTTFTPPQGNNPCEQGGTAKLYGLNYQTGGGALPTSGTPRSMDVGTGIASAPVVSLKPAGSTIPDLYVTTSGGGGTGSQTARVPIDPPSVANRTNMLYWRDRRVDQ